MGQAQINVRTRACSRTSIARTRQAALTHNVRGKELSTALRLWSCVLTKFCDSHLQKKINYVATITANLWPSCHGLRNNDC